MLEYASKNNLPNVLLLSDQACPMVDFDLQIKTFSTKFSAETTQTWDLIVMGGLVSTNATFVNNESDSLTTFIDLRQSDISVRCMYALAVYKNAYQPLMDKILKGYLQTATISDILIQIPNLKCSIYVPNLFVVPAMILCEEFTIESDDLGSVFANFDPKCFPFYCDPIMYQLPPDETRTYISSNSEVLVTIIMIVKNQADDLLDAIHCIINQTLSNWQLIIIDNHSDDHTDFIIKELKESDNRIVSLHVDYVLTHAFEKCIEKALSIASGKYTTFQTPHQLSMPYRLQRQVSEMFVYHPLFCCGVEVKVTDIDLDSASKQCKSTPSSISYETFMCETMMLNQLFDPNTKSSKISLYTDMVCLVDIFTRKFGFLKLTHEELSKNHQNFDMNVYQCIDSILIVNNKTL
jgi:hypothetical protein